MAAGPLVWERKSEAYTVDWFYQIPTKRPILRQIEGNNKQNETNGDDDDDVDDDARVSRSACLNE